VRVLPVFFGTVVPANAGTPARIQAESLTRGPRVRGGDGLRETVQFSLRGPMPKFVMSLEGQVVQSFELTRERTSFGRHPDNDIVVTHPTVSARHAAFIVTNGQVVLEDLGSTNGSFVNGKRVTRQLLADGDRLMLAMYHLDYEAKLAPEPPVGMVTVTNGPHVNKSLKLTKPLTTLGSTGECVVAISRGPAGYAVAFVDGSQPATLNHGALGREPQPLRHGDVLNVAGTSMSFSVDA